MPMFEGLFIMHVISLLTLIFNSYFSWKAKIYFKSISFVSKNFLVINANKIVFKQTI